MRVSNANGYTVITDQTDSPIASVRIIVNAGSAREVAPSAGTAHFLEHMFFRGTQDKTTPEMQQATSRLGDVNAYTSFNRTVFTFSCLSQNICAALQLMFEMLLDPRFDPADFETERCVILEEISSRDADPTSYFFDHAMAGFLGDNYQPIIGTSDSVMCMQLGDLRRFRAGSYGRNNIAIAVIGDVQHGTIQTQVLSITSADSGVAAAPDSEPPRDWDFADLALRHSSQQAIVTLAWPAPGRSQSLAERYADSVLYNGLGGGQHSLLYQRLRDQLGLCYSTFAFDYDRAACLFTMLDAKAIGQAQDEMKWIVANALNEGFSAELLQTSKANVMFQIARQSEASSGRGASIMDNYFERGCVLLEPSAFIAMVDGTTNDDVVRCAQQIFGGQFKTVTMTHADAESRSDDGAPAARDLAKAVAFA